MKPTQRIVLTDLRLRRFLPKVGEQLGKVSRERLAAIAPLFGGEGRARISECLGAAFPGLHIAAALKQFTNFQGDVNRAAKLAELGLVFVSDSRKRHTPEARYCWFEGGDSAAEEIEEFSREGTIDLSTTAILSRGLATNWADILATAGQVRVFVSYAHDDAAYARELVEAIKIHWCAAVRGYENVPDPHFFWVDWEIPGGAEWRKKIDDAMSQCDVGLFLYSAHTQASDFIDKVEWPHFRDANKPVVPVRFGPVVAESPAFRMMRKKHQFVEFAATGENSVARSYADIRLNRRHKAEFVTAILRGIAGAMTELRGVSTVSDLLSTSPGKPVADNTELLSSMAVEAQGGDDVEHYESSSALSTTLDQLENIDVRKGLPSGRVAPALGLVEHWLAQPDKKAAPFFAVLGEIGIGKTTLLKQLTRRLLDKRARGEAVPLPIFVDLRLYYTQEGKRTVPTLEELLAEVIRRHWKGGGQSPLRPAEIIDAVQNRGALIIFDGLDEKIVHHTPEQARQFLRELWRILPPGAVASKRSKRSVQRGRMIVSCRSHYFRDAVSQSEMLRGEGRDGLRSAHYDVCVVLPFTAEQVRHHLERLLGGVAAARAAIELFNSVHNLAELSRRPYLLTLMAGQLDELRRKRAAGQRVNGASLYGLLVDKWLARDDGKHLFTTAHKLAIMEALAADLHVDRAREWPWRRVEAWLDRYLADRPEVAGRYAGAASDLLHEDFRTATFVLRPDDSRESFRFAHSSLQEFFHARHLVDALIKGAMAAWKIEMPSLETLDFAGQLLATGDASRALVSLGALLTNGDSRSARLALRYWLLAIERGYPEPDLDGRAVKLAGLDLENWTVRGRATDLPLPLGEADFSGARLEGARFEHVYLAAANFSKTRCTTAEFRDVNFSRADFSDADFTGAVLCECILEGARAAKARWYEADLIRCDIRDADWPANFSGLGVMACCTSSDGRVTSPSGLAAGGEMIVRSGHWKKILSCAWSPDGRRLASVSEDRMLKVWDVETGKCLHSFVAHQRPVYTCTWSPDGRRLATGSADNTLKIWDAETGKCLRSFAGHNNSVYACAWSPDGRRLVSGSWDNTMRSWDVETGECLHRFTGHENSVHACAWSPDGRHLASSAGDKTVKIWDPETGKCLRTFAGHEGPVYACGWSPDGRRLASGSGDGTAKVWDAETGKCLRSFTGHEGRPVYACAWSPNGRRLASGSRNNAVKVWDAETGKCLHSLAGHESSVCACAWSPDGRRLASSSEDRVVKVWDAETGKCLRSFVGHENPVYACAWSPDGRRLASSSGDRMVKMWDAETGKCLRKFAGHENWVSTCGWSPDGRRLASGSGDNTVKVWDAETGKCLRSFIGHKHQVHVCVWSPDGRRLASGSADGTAKVWDVETGKCIRNFVDHRYAVTACAWSPNGRRLASGSVDSTVKVWEAETGKCLCSLESHSDSVQACAWSPDGRRLASGSWDKTVRVWDTQTGKCLQKFADHEDPVTACMWSPDGRRLVSSSWDRTVKVWDAETGQCQHTLAGHENVVRACGWSPDGRQLASASDDSTVKLWDAQTGKCLRSFVSLPGGETAALDFVKNGFSAASPGAWRHIGWRVFDPEAEGWGSFDADQRKWVLGPLGRTRILPAEFFGEIPS